MGNQDGFSIEPCDFEVISEHLFAIPDRFLVLLDHIVFIVLQRCQANDTPEARIQILFLMQVKRGLLVLAQNEVFLKLLVATVNHSEALHTGDPFFVFESRPQDMQKGIRIVFKNIVPFLFSVDLVRSCGDQGNLVSRWAYRPEGTHRRHTASVEDLDDLLGKFLSDSRLCFLCSCSNVRGQRDFWIHQQLDLRVGLIFKYI